MNYESKYNELVEAARAVVEGNPGLCKIDEGLGRLSKLLPEKESEDERIRKYIITRVMEEENIPHYLRELIIAYLEKQKEPLTPEEKMNHPLYLEGFDVGKKVGEALKEQKQPEVDLWKEIHRYFNPHGMDLQFDRGKGVTIFKPEQLINFARHFYELGLNARKEG